MPIDTVKVGSPAQVTCDVRSEKMKIVINTVIICLLATGCTSVHFADPHGHVVDVHAKPWSGSPLRMVRVDPPPSDSIRDIVTNQSATVRAYVFEKPWKSGTFRDHIQIQFLDSGKVFEIERHPLEYRPFSDLVWIEDRYLVFDSWTQPHFGWHNVVDVMKRERILVTSFPDQFWYDQQKPKIYTPPDQVLESTPAGAAHP